VIFEYIHFMNNLRQVSATYSRTKCKWSMVSVSEQSKSVLRGLV